MTRSPKNIETVNDGMIERAVKNLDDCNEHYNQSIINKLIELEAYEDLEAIHHYYRARGKKMPGYDPYGDDQQYLKRIY